MAKGLTQQQRTFCELYASNMPAGRAYEQAGYKARGNAAEAAASRLLTNVKVKTYVEEIQAQSSEDCRWSRKQAMDYLCDVLETPIGKINPNHVMAQSHQEATERSGEKITMPGKIEAFRELAKMCDWYTPVKVEVKGTVTSILEQIDTPLLPSEGE